MVGWDWDGRKSLKGVILRAPLCGANKKCFQHGLRESHSKKYEISLVLLLVSKSFEKH